LAHAGVDQATNQTQREPAARPQSQFRGPQLHPAKTNGEALVHLPKKVRLSVSCDAEDDFAKPSSRPRNRHRDIALLRVAELCGAKSSEDSTGLQGMPL
jgi:hypothetical protein